MNPAFTFQTVASILADGEARLRGIAGEYVDALQARGGVPHPAAPEDPAKPHFLFIATGGTEQQALELWTARAELHPDEPALLIAHPGHNSLPAALEILARLQQEGAAGRIFYLTGPDDERGWRQVAEAVHDLEVRRELCRARIGLIGAPSDWLIASSPPPEVVREMWGPQVIPLPMEALVKAMEAVPAAALAPLVTDLIQEDTEICEPAPAALQEAARVTAGLQRLVQEQNLDALTLRCFDLVLERQTTGCFALSHLTDAGCIAGCEGDLVSTVGLLWASRLLNTLPWMANPARIDEEANSLWLAHCTVPRRLVASYRLRSHFESGLGVGIAGELLLGPVTLLRIGGSRMEQLWLAQGEVVETGEAENLCRTQAHLRLEQGHVRELLRAPLGNHLVLVPGHHAERLRTWQETYLSPKQERLGGASVIIT